MAKVINAYAFEKNILVLSRTKNIEELPKEWFFVSSYENGNGHCICNRKIKIINFFVNIETGHTIQAGSGCCKHLKLETNASHDNILVNLLKEYSAEYENIFDLLRYSEKMRENIIQHFSSMFQNLPVNQIITSNSFIIIEVNRKILVNIRDILNTYTKNNIQCDKLEGLYKKWNDYNNTLVEQEVIFKQKKIEEEKKVKEDREREAIVSEQNRQLREQRNKKRAEEWENKEKEITIQRQKVLREEAIQRQKIEDEEREEKEKEEELKKKKHADFWNRFK